MSASDFKRQLTLVQRNSQAGNAAMAKQAQDLAQAATPAGFLSLLLSANLITDWPFGLALVAAILKDILDIAIIGSLPGPGTAITLCISAFIGFMLLLGSITSGTGLGFQKSVKKLLVLVIGTGGELIFGVDFLPIETITVLAIYVMTLIDRKAAEKEAENQKAASEALQAQAINYRLMRYQQAQQGLAEEELSEAA